MAVVLIWVVVVVLAVAEAMAANGAKVGGDEIVGRLEGFATAGPPLMTTAALGPALRLNNSHALCTVPFPHPSLNSGGPRQAGRTKVSLPQILFLPPWVLPSPQSRVTHTRLRRVIVIQK